uniref:Uncharacterized protein n=1 Tax=Candidatus Magnetananas rongchengensis TaxID=1463558 RepID=A0A3Q8BG44_9BACT|nr:hypothetical protein [Candidatus Magnetananas rongchenensis]
MSSLETMLIRIEDDLRDINEKFGILSEKELRMLSRDIKYVFLDNIAKEIKLVFYDHDDTDVVYSEYVYSIAGSVKIKGDMSVEDTDNKNVVFDVFIEFMDDFQKLNSQLRNILLKNTELEWLT